MVPPLAATRVGKNQKWRPVKIGLGALAPWRPGDGSTLGGQVMDESGDQSWEKSKVEARVGFHVFRE